MLTIRKSASILNALKAAGLISDYELHDDGKNEKPGERYWSEVFIEDIAAGGVMGDDKRDVMQRTVFEKLLPVFRQQRPPAIDRRAAGARERRSGEDRGRLTALAGGSFEQRGTSWASAGGTKFGSVAGE